MNRNRQLIALRGVLIAAFSTSVALFFHILAGGNTASPLALLMVLLLSTIASAALVRLKLNVFNTSVAVIFSQFLFHWLFVLGSGASKVVEVEVSGLPAATGFGHSHHTSSISFSVAPETSHLLHAGPAMVFSHLFAAVLTIIILHYFERVVRSLSALLRAIWRGLVIDYQSLITILVAHPQFKQFFFTPELAVSTDFRLIPLLRGPPLR